MDRVSYRGRPLPLGLRLFGALLLSVSSLGLLAPFALWFTLAYACRHTTVGVEPIVFRARPLAFFVAVAKLVIFSLLSLGLYAPLAWIRFLQWLFAHIECRGRPMTFVGDGPGLLLVLGWSFVISFLSLGLLIPWALLEILRFHADRSVVGTWRFDLHPPALAFLGRSWLDITASIATLGLYTPWAADRQLRFLAASTEIVPATRTPELGVRAPAVALASIALAGLLLAAVHYREDLPLEALETELFQKTRAVLSPPAPFEGGHTSGAGASASADPAADRACCTAMVPAEPELRAVKEEGGTLVITNEAP